MLVAHLPAGYLMTSAIVKRPMSLSKHWPGLLGSVLPDLDILYFYTLGGRQQVHHTYWTHLPVFWLLFGGIVFACGRVWPQAPTIRKVRRLFLPNLFLHLLLDSVAAGILWLVPFSGERLHLFEVPARHGHWILNFVLHWTFWLELVIVVAALLVLALHLRARKRNRKGLQPV